MSALDFSNWAKMGVFAQNFVQNFFQCPKIWALKKRQKTSFVVLFQVESAKIIRKGGFFVPTSRAEAILQRNRQYIDHLSDSKVEYFSYLSTMSRFHKFRADEVVSFALDAPKNFTAMASLSLFTMYLKPRRQQTRKPSTFGNTTTSNTRNFLTLLCRGI